MRKCFDKVRFFFEQENFNRKLPGWDIAESLSECRQTALEVGQQAPALGFISVCEEQEVFGRNLEPFGILSR